MRRNLGKKENENVKNGQDKKKNANDSTDQHFHDADVFKVLKTIAENQSKSTTEMEKAMENLGEMATAPATACANEVKKNVEDLDDKVASLDSEMATFYIEFKKHAVFACFLVFKKSCCFFPSAKHL